MSVARAALGQHASCDEDWCRVWWVERWLPGWLYRTQHDVYPWGSPYSYDVLRQPLRAAEALHGWLWGWAYALKALWCLYVLRGGTAGTPPAGRVLGPADNYVLVAITSEPRYNYGAAMATGGQPYDWDELVVGHGWRRGTWWAEERTEGNY